MSIFDQAKSLLTSGIVESFFPGGEWRGQGDYWICSPLRADSSIGSFHIQSTPDGWFYKDFSSDDGGDFIALVSKARGISLKEAAEAIVRAAGATPEEKPAPSRAKKTKIPALVPIPDEAREKLNAEIVSSWARENHGEKAGGWKYYTADGGWAFAVVRYNKPDGSKDVIPYYYGTDERWHEGQAFADARPLYNLPEIINAPDDARFLVVEGEKDASVKVPGWILTTWSAGASSSAKTDWTPLEKAAKEGRVTIWPDADEPGRKAAAAIARRLPGAKILDIQGRAAGWDIADAVVEGIDPAAFIASCPSLNARDDLTAPDAETAQFFRCLGFDDELHWFLREGKRVPQSIPRGNFNASKIQELAPLAFWSMQGMVTDQQTVKVSIAQDWIQEIQLRVGRFVPERLRGSGVWNDDGDIIMNDGRKIVTRDGKTEKLGEFKTRFFYLSSEAQFGDMESDASTDQEGRDLWELFKAQGFAREVHALAVMGWSLIAPFGGVLAWRPHLWLSGRRGTGKSWIMEHLISELCGPFGYIGTGKDTEAGIRRALRVDARPAIIDEAEPMGRASTEKLTAILTLIRNASSDQSARVTVARKDGGVETFRIRSCFCLGSIRMSDRDAAIDSRIIHPELRFHTKEQMTIKKARTKDLLARCMKDPGRFRRRVFRALPQVLANIEFLRDEGLADLIDQRAQDQWAPILAAVFEVMEGGTIQTERGAAFVQHWLEEIAGNHGEMIEDEDRVVSHILGALIETDQKKRRTVAEVLKMAGNMACEAHDEMNELAARHGLKIVTRHDGGKVLAIAVNSDQIKRMLAGTPYEEGYSAQIKRHPLCMSPEKSRTADMGGSRAVHYLKWDEFKDAYLAEKEEEEEIENNAEE